MSKPIKEHISRIKSILRINDMDSRVTDRTIYLAMKKYRPFVLERNPSKFKRSTDLFQIISDVELEEVDVTDSCYISTDCKIKRTVKKYDNIIQDKFGPIVKRIMALDEDTEIIGTTNSSYKRKIKKPSFKYNKNLYYWFSNDRFYFPDLEWDFVKIEALFEDDQPINCCDDESQDSACKPFYESDFTFPDDLEAVLEDFVKKDLSITLQVREDHFVNKNDNIDL